MRRRKNTTLFVVGFGDFCRLCSSLACPLYRFFGFCLVVSEFCVLAVPVGSVDVDLSGPAEKGDGNLNCAGLEEATRLQLIREWK
jgi:hypothetical protein